MANSVHKTATYAFLLGLALLASADGKPVSESQLKRSADCKPVSESRLKRSDDGGPVGAVVEQLSSHVTSLSAQLTALSSKVAILEAKAGKDETVIAFHARQEVHDFEVLPRGPIILQHVTTRVGTGYDEKTGWFQAPMSGTYLFVATVTVVSPDIAWVNVMVDDKFLAALVMSSSHGADFDQGSVSVPLHLIQGQRVHLTNASVNKKRLLGGIYTTFSGLLVHRD